MCTCYSLNVVLVINAGITLRSFGTAQRGSKRTKAPCDRGKAHVFQRPMDMPKAARLAPYERRPKTATEAHSTFPCRSALLRHIEQLP